MSANGNWIISMDTPMGKQEGQLSLNVDGNTLTGYMEQMGAQVNLDNGTLDGDALSWDASITTPMPMTLNFKGTLVGDTITGDVTLGAFGNATFEANRT